MLDFLLISTRTPKRGILEIYPKFIIKKSEDLMIRGGDFYAIWIEEQGLWSTSEDTAIALIDRELDEFAQKYKDNTEDKIKVFHMWDAESGSIDKWHKYCQKQMRDNFHPLDEKLIFANTDTIKKDYASKKLPYPLVDGKCDAYDELMSTLYSEEERRKIEWAIGAIVSGESVLIQKFLVMYGAAGTGKSTVLNIIQKLFEGYYSVFDAKAMGMSNNSFALEAFKSNPLVAIQHDGDLSRIEDNTRLNSVVSHELMTVNEKFKTAYANRFNCFLFIGTNKPVKITDARSGIIRRLIDVSPSGKKVSQNRYKTLVSQINFELGQIASRCLEVYLEDPGYYDDYIPVQMLGASNDFYNFVTECYDLLSAQEGVTLKSAWEAYKTYCTEAKVLYPLSQRPFKEELRNYFKIFEERAVLADGTRVRNLFTEFDLDKFKLPKERVNDEKTYLLEFNMTESLYDREIYDCPAQYTKADGTPRIKWENVKTTLQDIDTSKLHFVIPPDNHIVIDFDLTDETGKKNFELNVEAASKWPPTYAELSKSGCGIHLHYIYDGNVDDLSKVYAPGIEIKTFTGKSSLRRLVTKCNSKPIAKLSSGLPIKRKGDKVVNSNNIEDEKHLRRLIRGNLAKEYHDSTKCSVDFIFKLLDDAYNSGMSYDVSDLKPAVQAFCAKSTNQSKYCLDLFCKMKFSSEDHSPNTENYNTDKVVFFDIEVYPNLLLVCWKLEGPEHKVVRMYNPTPEQIESLLGYKLVGFNNRRYDNHIIYARLMGYNNEQLYKQSQRIINGSANAFFGEAYNLSYADIYEFASKKQSLKKWEIELGIHHQEMDIPWDQPAPEDMWNKIGDYCENDVLATEAVWNERKADFVARQILAALSGLTCNDTTRMHTTKIIFGDDKNPELVYTDLSKDFPGYTYDPDTRTSTYRDEVTGEGGYVYAEPGAYFNVALLDIASMHPSSIINLNLFGNYTSKFKDILDARLYIKHHEFNKAKTLMNGALEPYLQDENMADTLAGALKIVINSVYGFTTATFDNPFRDPRNIDNIVAKRGALFMVNLKHEVQERGFTVAHIKTDSIKIPNATPEIIQFVMDYGKKYGYNFEHEATYSRMCLVNDAVYIAQYKDGKHAGEWTATGTQFQVPYVFKTLFSKEPILFSDMCETKAVSTALYLDMNEDLPEDEHSYKFVGKVGLFCPIIPGRGGGLLLRETATSDGEKKYGFAVGAKGYRWLEAEMVKQFHKEDDIDISYYALLVDEAVATIEQYIDFNEFIFGEPSEDIPFEGSYILKNHDHTNGGEDK